MGVATGRVKPSKAGVKKKKEKPPVYTGFFTDPTLKSTDLETPPVEGCECAYCTSMRLYGWAVRGVGSHPSGKVKGGDERHNPENKARIMLKEVLTNEQFQDYVVMRQLWAKGPSGLWYLVGDNPNTSKRLGSGISCYDRRHGTPVALFCFRMRTNRVPLADVVYSFLLYVKYNEKELWTRAQVTYLTNGAVDVARRAGVLKYYNDPW